MYNSEIFKTPPEGIQVKQEDNHVTITVDGNFSVYAFYGLLVLAFGVLLAYFILSSQGNRNATAIVLSLAFFIGGGVMLFFDYRSKTTTTHITIDAQNHVDISTHRHGNTVESVHFDHIQELAYREITLYRDGLIKTAPVHRIIPIISDGEQTFTMPKLPKAKWEWLQQLFSELIDLYDAQLKDQPDESAAAEEALRRA